MTIATVIGFIAGTLTTVSFVPQVLKTFRTKRCNDLSFGMLSAFASGVCLWLVYGIFLWSAPIIVANLVTLCLLVPLVVMEGPLPSGDHPMTRSCLTLLPRSR